MTSSIIIKASEEYEDTPWLLYDARFRQQAATEPKRPWATIDASLWTTCFALAKAKPWCKDCKEMRHTLCRPFQRQGTSHTQPPYLSVKNSTIRAVIYGSATSVTYALGATSHHRIAECPDVRKDNKIGREPFQDSFREVPERQKQLNQMITLTVN